LNKVWMCGNTCRQDRTSKMEPGETVLAELLICPEMFLTGYNIGDFDLL